MMDWFEKITGFRELPYEQTQAKLWVEDGCLRSCESASRFAVGRLEIPSLADLRERARACDSTGPTKVTCVVGDARKLHADPMNRSALFQVASQFNLLEMVGPSITPEHGVTRYVHDRTQGPACAIAAGAATIYRNYLVPFGESRGQRTYRQIDCLADLRSALGCQEESMGTMQNGYALSTASGLQHMDAVLEKASPDDVDRLRGLLRIGIHWDVGVTDSSDDQQLVSQAFCSALPVAYTGHPASSWRRFASLVLEATYEATLLAAVMNVARRASNVVMLTRVGGGAFGNDPEWIDSAINRALKVIEYSGLDVRIVCFGRLPSNLQRMCLEAR
jgi:hypothetical protein